MRRISFAYSSVQNKRIQGTTSLKIKPKASASAVSTALYTITKPIHDGYQPQFVNHGYASNGIDNSRLENAFENFGLTALAMLPFLKSQQEALKNMVDVKNSFLNLMDGISKALLDYTKVFSEAQNAHYQANVQEQKEQEHTTAIISLLEGIAKFLVGLDMFFDSIVTLNIPGILSGIYLASDGASQVVESTRGLLNPEEASGDKTLKSVMQSGLLGFAGSSGALIQQVLMITTTILSAGENLLTNLPELFSNLGIKTVGILFNIGYTVANAITSVIGMAESVESDQGGLNTTNDVDIKQICTMGIIPLIAYEIINKTPIHDWLVKELGDSGKESAVEMSIMFICNIAAMVAHIKLNSYLSQDTTSAELQPDSIKKARQILSSFMQYINMANTFNQTLSGVSAAVNETYENIISKQENSMRYEQEINSVVSNVLTQNYSFLQQISAMLDDNTQDIARDIQDFTKGLSAIVRKDAQSAI